MCVDKKVIIVANDKGEREGACEVGGGFPGVNDLDGQVRLWKGASDSRWQYSHEIDVRRGKKLGASGDG